MAESCALMRTLYQPRNVRKHEVLFAIDADNA